MCRPPFLALVGLLVAAFGVFLAFEMLHPVIVKQPLSSRNMWHAKEMATACGLYASDNKGRFPASLAEVSPDYIPSESVSLLRYILDEKRTPPVLTDWLYFGAGFTDKNPPPILIAAPNSVIAQNPELQSGKELRVYVAGDGRGWVRKEAHYQALLSETMRQIQALQASGKPEPQPAH